MDITTLAPKPTAKHVLAHPITGEPLVTSKGDEMHAVIYGKDSREYKAALAKMYKSQLEAAGGDKDHEFSESEQNEFIYVVMESVIESVLFEGPDGISNDVSAFVRNPDLKFFVDQIDAAMQNRANFMTA